MSSARFVSAAEAAGGAGVVMAAVAGAGVMAVAAGGVSVEPAFHDASVLAATAMGLAAAMVDGAPVAGFLMMVSTAPILSWCAARWRRRRRRWTSWLRESRWCEFGAHHRAEREPLPQLCLPCGCTLPHF